MFFIAQTHVKPGQPGENFAGIVSHIEEARGAGAKTVVFPELCLTGYFNGARWEDEDFLKDALHYGERMRELSRGLTLAWGNIDVDWDRRRQDGNPVMRNAVYVARDGAWAGGGVLPGRFCQTRLADYRWFHDAKLFESAADAARDRNVPLDGILRPIEMPWADGVKKVGVLVGDDAWGGTTGAPDPAAVLVANGAEVLLNISSSPWTWRKHEKRLEVLGNHARAQGVPVLSVNATGIENTGKNVLTYDGRSCYVTPDGSTATFGGKYQSGLLPFLPGAADCARATPDEAGDVRETVATLIYGIREFFAAHGRTKALVAVSGGIDSQVTMALMAIALGAGNVYAVNMPSDFSSGGTQSLARAGAKALGVHYAVVPIQPGVDLTVAQLEAAAFTNLADGSVSRFKVTSRVLENVHARDRGSRLLAAFAAMIGGALIVNTANKTEIATGYGALHGNLIGGVTPLGDVHKDMVYKIARYLNANYSASFGVAAIIPEASLTMPSTTELRRDQTHPYHYDYHPWLFRSWMEYSRDKTGIKNPADILEAYAAGRLEETLGLAPGTVAKHFATSAEFIADLELQWETFHNRGTHKRLQGQPSLAVSRRGFGDDFPESLGSPYYPRRYRELKDKFV